MTISMGYIDEGGGMGEYLPGMPRLPPKMDLSDDGRKAILAAFRAEIRVQLDKEPFGQGELYTVEQLAMQARKVAGFHTPQGLGAGSNLYANAGVLAQSPPLETFGGSAIRELVAALPELLKKPSPPPPRDGLEEIIFAISAAKKEGLTDIVETLSAELKSRMDENRAVPKPPSTIDADYEEAGAPHEPHHHEAAPVPQ